VGQCLHKNIVESLDIRVLPPAGNLIEGLCPPRIGSVIQRKITVSWWVITIVDKSYT